MPVAMTPQHSLLIIFLATSLTCPARSLGQNVNNLTSDEIPRDSKSADTKAPLSRTLRKGELVDRNRGIYYKNKLEFSLESGWLPVNIPFPFDVFLGDGYNQTPLCYTLVPTIASLRWQTGNIRGPGILRGNWDMTFSAAFTAIARGPETHYGAYDMGIRRNFVRRSWRTALYFEGRLGVGRIDAKGPEGVPYAQGQDFTFTMMMGSGVRYNFNPTYAFSAGLTWMHVSNLYLSEPKYLNYGINVYGPIVGLNVRLRRPKGAVARY